MSAPAGSTWTLDDATTWRPRLLADRVGPYRVRLVVTDATGRESEEAEVLVKVGPQCADGVDDDLDGLIDTDDPDCDGPPSPPPPALTDSERWATNVYVDLLGRAPDPDGLAWWAAQLDAGTPRSVLAARLLRTTEGRAHRVRVAYEATLERTPAAGEVAFWSALLDAGVSFDRVLVLLLASAEAQRQAGPTTRDLVALAYRRLAGREATPAELDAGVALIAGSGKGAFLHRLVRSDEVARRWVTLLYGQLLRRPPDDAGLAYWAARLSAGVDVTVLWLRLVSSPEYATLPLRP